MGVLKNWLRGVFLGLSIVWSFDAEAICLGSGDARIEALSKAASRNPVDALRLTDLDILAASRSHTSDMRKKAWLEVLRASALALLSRDDDRLETVRSQAHRSLDARDPVLLQLDLFSAYRLQSQNELLERLNAIDAARSHQPAGSAANVCTEISLGYLLYRSGHPELALGKVMEAYSNGKKAGLMRERAEAASVLSMIMRAQWDFDRALELATESIDYASAENMHEQLFVDLLNRGWIYNSLHEHNRALADFGSARQHAQSAGDQSGIGYADEAACQANMDLGRAGEALSRCNSAIAFLRAYPDPLIRQAKTYQAAALLGLGQPKRALIILNDVLGGKGDQQVLFKSSAAYMERAHTYAALGRFGQAYADLETSRKTLEREHEKEITRRQSLLRARFMSDQQRERNISLQRELSFARERESARTNRIILLLIISTLGSLFLVYVIVMGSRHRRQLQRHRDDVLELLSHDMRAPQASIIALLDHNDPGDWGPETAQRIKTYARRTLKLADDFVHLSRAQILQYELATLNIVDIAYDAIDALWPQARLRQISLDATIEDDEILIRGEHSLLMRALINLLDNAVKFSTNSSVVRFAMSRTLHDQREFVVCSVIDTGVGIPPEKMATLFSRFASARPNPTGGVGGVGLGLAFVKTVVTRHGGTIHCDSQEGRGTTFRIELPAVAGTPESGTIAA